MPKLASVVLTGTGRLSIRKMSAGVRGRRKEGGENRGQVGAHMKPVIASTGVKVFIVLPYGCKFLQTIVIIQLAALATRAWLAYKCTNNTPEKLPTRLDGYDFFATIRRMADEYL